MTGAGFCSFIAAAESLAGCRIVTSNMATVRGETYRPSRPNNASTAPGLFAGSLLAPRFAARLMLMILAT